MSELELAASVAATQDGGGTAVHPREAKRRWRLQDIKQVKDIIINLYLPLLFGIFGFRALQAAGVANDQSFVANQLALLSLCYSNSSTNLCEALLAQHNQYLPAIASKMYIWAPINATTATEYSFNSLTSQFGEGHANQYNWPFIIISLAAFAVMTIEASLTRS